MPKPQLNRSIGLFALTFYGLGTILGAGIYVLIGSVAGRAGLFAPFSFALAALLAAFTALCFAELSSRFPKSAGEAVYVSEGLGVRGLAVVVGFLVIGNGVIIDNQVQIAHNVRIGAHTAMAAGCKIAGSTTIGKHCIFGGGSGVAGHLTVADHVHLTAMTMVIKSLNEAGVYSSGTGVQPNAKWRKSIARLRQLDQLAGRVKKLEQTVKQERGDHTD